MEFSEKVAQIKKVDFMAFVPESALSELARNCPVIEIEKDQVLFEEGDPGDTMYVVLSGELAVYLKGKILVCRTPGQYFGEMALIESKPRSASIRAITKSLLLEISKEQFESHFTSNPKALMALLRTLSDRSRVDLNTLDEGFERLKNQENLSERLRRILDDASNEIYFFCPENYHLVQVNSRSRENLGYTADEINGLTFLDIVKEPEQKEIDGFVQSLLQGKTPLVVRNGFHQRKNGSTYPVEIRLQLSQTEDVPLIVAIVEDTTARKQLEDRMKQMAFYDSLTQLPNRNLLSDRMDVAIAHAGRHEIMMAVLLMDMDNIKEINDSLGHHVGDLILQEVAQRLTRLLREEDTVGRLGGDEFVMLFSHIKNEDDAIQLTKKIQDTLHKPCNVAGHEIQTSFSIGIAIYPKDGMNSSSLLKKADAAMYCAKEEEGSSHKIYDPSMTFKGTRKTKIERELLRALEQDEFVLHYQTIVDANTENIVGVEALIRWKHPQSGLLLPMEFLPAAEESQLIVPIGEWVIKTACRQLAKWNGNGSPPLSLAVNLSECQFKHKDIVNSIQEILQETGIDSAWLALEITESTLMANEDMFRPRLRELSEIGVHLSIDDFGVGYSSPNFLKELPVRSLKIGSAFLQEHDQPSNTAILRTIVSLAHTLNLQTVAEGVETEDQKNFLRTIQCDLMQGYFFDKPAPTDQIAPLLRNRA